MKKLSHKIYPLLIKKVVLFLYNFWLKRIPHEVNKQFARYKGGRLSLGNYSLLGLYGFSYQLIHV